MCLDDSTRWNKYISSSVYERCKRFACWQIKFIKHEDTAEAGFYYPHTGMMFALIHTWHTVDCCFISIHWYFKLVDWKIGEGPMTEHSKWAPFRCFVKDTIIHNPKNPRNIVVLWMSRQCMLFTTLHRTLYHWYIKLMGFIVNRAISRCKASLKNEETTLKNARPNSRTSWIIYNWWEKIKSCHTSSPAPHYNVQCVKHC